MEQRTFYISEEVKEELDFFKRSNGHYTVQAGKNTCKICDAPDEIVYMCMSASLAMEYFEDGFFEDFVITDKVISGKTEMLIDAYALIETAATNVKHLHIFQFKMHEGENNSASPKELLSFANYVNDNFVHPVFADVDQPEETTLEIKKIIGDFLSTRRGRRIEIKCHYITNAKGITKSNKQQIQVILSRFQEDKKNLGFVIDVYGNSEIVDLAKNGKIQIGEETIEILNDGSSPYRLEDNTRNIGLGIPKKVLIGMCNVNELIRLQDKYHYNELYSDNIRLYLGDRGNVNKDIISTITSSSSIWFPYMNNGISIICDKMTIDNIIEKKKVCRVSLQNMQIINGCQTVNALYSAKYNENTKDYFRPANVLVRIYEIAPELHDFKMNIIKATNNQNAVKSYSLVANDAIQKRIAEIMSKFGIVYDRKGEGRTAKANQRIVSMVNVALSYRAVYKKLAKSLRSGLGKSRVFNKTEYEQIFNPELLDDDKKDKLFKLCSQLIVADTVMNKTRDLIVSNENIYVDKLPIFKKSAYYLSGFLFMMKEQEINQITKEMIDGIVSGNEKKLEGSNYPKRIEDLIMDSFNSNIDKFITFYDNLKIEKKDIDNLLKSNDFNNEYWKLIGHTTQFQNLD